MEEEEYLILQCPACERSVKIKSDASGTRMGCPYCKEPIEVTESAPEVPALGDDDEIERPPLAFRRIQETEAGSSPKSQGQGQSGSTTPGAPVRQKRRKRQMDAPDWDEDPGKKAKRQQADGAATHDDSSEFLEMDPDAPGGVRLKRVRRKKLLSTKEKFIRGLVVGLLVIAVGIACVIGYTAVVRSIEIARQDQETLRQLPDEVQGRIDKVLSQESPISLFLTGVEEEAASAIVEGFLKAKTIEDREPFVRNRDKVSPLMRDWYSKNPIEDWPPQGEILKRKKILDQGRYFIILYIEYLNVGRRIFAIEQTEEEGMRLDWETATGYQPMPLDEFKSARPADPVKFWVKVKPSTYYNFGFSDPEKYQAVELSYPGRGDFKLIGYIDRSRAWAPNLIKRLEQGEAPSLIVELQYPEEVKDESQVEIVEILSESWWQ